MSHLESALEMICTARRYTEDLLDKTPLEDWFRLPAEGVTHVAWQAGHLAVAEYHLTMKRIRGARSEDTALVSDDFLKVFGKGSVPLADPAQYPTPEEIRRVLSRVHEQALAELRDVTDAVLDEPVDPPHPLFRTKLGALRWCAQHEILHAGQIGLLRRLFGHEPLR
jgi:uncharacterized damage-inducible protein DinB